MSKRQSSGHARVGIRKSDSNPPPSTETAPETADLDEFDGDESVDSLDEIKEVRSRMSSF